MTYDNSRLYCQGTGGDLAVVKHFDLSIILKKYLYWAPPVWIGLKDSNNNDNSSQFVWVDGSIANSYTNWGNFSYLSNYDCVQIVKYSSFHAWSNLPCSYSAWQLCETGQRSDYVKE